MDYVAFCSECSADYRIAVDDQDTVFIECNCEADYAFDWLHDFAAHVADIEPSTADIEVPDDPRLN